MNAEELVGLISHFDLSWHKLRRNLVYDREAGLEGTMFGGQDPITVMKAAVAVRRQIVDEMLDEVMDTICAEVGGEFVRDQTPDIVFHFSPGHSAECNAFPGRGHCLRHPAMSKNCAEGVGVDSAVW